MAERKLPKLEVAGSIPVTRSRRKAGGLRPPAFCASGFLIPNSRDFWIALLEHVREVINGMVRGKHGEIYGEAEKGRLSLGLGGRLRPEFRGAKVTTDAGLLV